MFRAILRYGLPSLLPLFLQLIIGSVSYIILFNFISLYFILKLCFLLQFFIFELFNPYLLLCSFCCVINVHLILGLLLKIDVDLSLLIFIHKKLNKI